MKSSAATQQAVEGMMRGKTEGRTDDKNMEIPGTLEELHKLLQIEGDRRVTQALKTASEKWREETFKKLDEEKQEARRLVARSFEAYEKEALEKYRREIEEKERALTEKELEIRMLYYLAENKLPLEFIDLILDHDEKSTLKRAELFCKVWKQKLHEAVKESLPGLSGTKHDIKTMEEFA